MSRALTIRFANLAREAERYRGVTIMAAEFEVTAKNDAALFSLKGYRGEGMSLLAMNWKSDQPPDNLVGFSIEFQPPGHNQFFALKNRINFRKADGSVNTTPKSTLVSPLQMFRWVHFPHDVSVAGQFTYRVKPAFMDDQNAITFGQPQQVVIDLTP